MYENICVSDFLTEENLIEVLQNTKKTMDIVLTGRNASTKLIEYADLVTEMKNIKHYYKKGIKAIKGLEY
ncbi:cob(I)yrinic acid a,c-diamide adenosyltransferase [Clostridium sp. MD294]|uniref:cob(I)yrinic acid a,c-diamide adenosyltransferase n=1 Tax=Clostridium sp. MD294 TaxID=97138 RepID=UPI002074708E|nr:cob(I)yrinic acid a,c-diamide adenosyltransferase [Clostridium sp. MD294]USF28630.1 Corrinoid adenosyltransferase [Clostridium sp. MD294]